MFSRSSFYVPLKGHESGAGKEILPLAETKAAPLVFPTPRSERRGAFTAELALIAAIFFVMILGIIEFARAFMVMELLNEGARRGCRVGAIEGTTTQQIKDATTNFLSSVMVGGATASVTINDGVNNIQEAQNVPAYTEITVNVSVPVTSVSWVPGFIFPSGTLQGQWTMTRE